MFHYILTCTVEIKLDSALKNMGKINCMEGSRQQVECILKNTCLEVDKRIGVLLIWGKTQNLC